MYFYQKGSRYPGTASSMHHGDFPGTTERDYSGNSAYTPACLNVMCRPTCIPSHPCMIRKRPPILCNFPICIYVFINLCKLCLSIENISVPQNQSLLEDLILIFMQLLLAAINYPETYKSPVGTREQFCSLRIGDVQQRERVASLLYSLSRNVTNSTSSAVTPLEAGYLGF